MAATSLPNRTGACYFETVDNSHDIWREPGAPRLSVSVFLKQVGLTIFVSNALFLALRPLRQPRIISDILCGVLLGTSGFSHSPYFHKIFPERSYVKVETVGYLGLMYHLFLVGLRFDPAALVLIGKKATSIALAAFFLPGIVGISTFYIVTSSSGSSDANRLGGMFWVIALTFTGSPVLAEVLASIKLLHSDIGRTATAAAVVSDVCAWALVILVIPMSLEGRSFYYPLLTTAGFVSVCLFGVRPALAWAIRKTSGEGNYSDGYVVVILMGVSAFGMITDVIGTHSMVGAFVFGLIMPNGELGSRLVLKMEECVDGILLPFFYVLCGVRVNLWEIRGVGSWALTVFVICLGWMAKVLSTLGISTFFNIQPREGVVLGLLMNCKSLLGLALLDVAWDKGALTVQQYSIMVLAFLIMTASVAPLIDLVYGPTKRFMNYKIRSVQATGSDTDFRVLSCIYSTRHIAPIINLLEISTGNMHSRLAVFGLHLVEVTGCTSAMLIVHDPHRPTRVNLHDQAQSDHIMKSLEDFEYQNRSASVQLLTILSPYESMCEDVCGMAEDKRVSLIILPFHRRSMTSGAMEDAEPAFRPVNQSVLENAPCSVALLVDRGLAAGTMRRTDSNRAMACRAVMLFVGGHDDREALAYAWRMAGHRSINLTVVRFLPGSNVVNIDPMELQERQGILTIVSNVERQGRLDDVYITEFRRKNSGNDSITYREVTVNNGDETVAAIREMDREFDLYIVGRSERSISPLTFGLAEWSEYPELGAIGDVLVSSNFSMHASVLVVQQYDPKSTAADEDGIGILDSLAYFKK
ncbi:cation/H(+) antiporter 15-like [Rhodamnia argentea]|uniref:Cation/H(+) antiporter 15-like n=1 Tax=Rhodamnia argentea TaxID=178133 RepID=A0A8B8R302_9MYRT|nr:cation/H(+) antiporter 15-like [Rhodamnia argentea]